MSGDQQAKRIEEGAKEINEKMRRGVISVLRDSSPSHAFHGRPQIAIQLY